MTQPSSRGSTATDLRRRLCALASGRGTVNFDSMATVEGNREFASEQRTKMTERMGTEFVDVLECELAVHHLRVPELV